MLTQVARGENARWTVALRAHLVVLLVAPSAVAGEPAGTLAVDPVELARGQEIVGRDDLSAEHYRYRYLFSSESNRAEFLAHPEQYEIQLGGACARMGPLSGPGNTELFAEHDGRIYIFASPACRETFLRDPFRFLDQPDPIPPDDPAARRKGMEWIDRAVVAAGGADAVDAAKSFLCRRERKEDSGGVTYDVVDSILLVFPQRLVKFDAWNEYQYSNVVDGEQAWYAGRENAYELHKQQRRALLKTYMARNLLSILKARRHADFIAHFEKSETMDYNGRKVPVEYVTAAFDGCSCVLGIDSETGRILSQQYRAQGPRYSFGMLKHTFFDYKDYAGVKYPARQSSQFEERELPDQSKWTIEINGAVDERMFVRPARAVTRQE